MFRFSGCPGGSLSFVVRILEAMRAQLAVLSSLARGSGLCCHRLVVSPRHSSRVCRDPGMGGEVEFLIRWTGWAPALSLSAAKARYLIAALIARQGGFPVPDFARPTKFRPLREPTVTLSKVPAKEADIISSVLTGLKRRPISIHGAEMSICRVLVGLAAESALPSSLFVRRNHHGLGTAGAVMPLPRTAAIHPFLASRRPWQPKGTYTPIHGSNWP